LKYFPLNFEKLLPNVRVRMPKFVWAYAFQNLYAGAHGKTCMRVPKFVCPCAFQNLYARAKICMLVSIPKFECAFE
jgi:hypothetical protein